MTNNIELSLVEKLAIKDFIYKNLMEFNRRKKWILKHNKINYKILNPVFKKVLIELQPFLEIFDLNYVVYLTNETNYFSNPKEETIKYDNYIKIPAPQTIIDFIEDTINSQIDNSYFLNISQDEDSYKIFEKCKSSEYDDVIFSSKENIITFNAKPFHRISKQGDINIILDTL